MPMNIARGGGGALRGLYLNAVSRPFRLAISQPHVRRVCIATHRGPLKPITGTVPSSSILSRQLVNTYATASQAKTDKKTTKTTKAKKPTKAASKKASTAKKTAKASRKPLTDEQKEAKKEAKKARELKQQIKELKVLALDPPKRPAQTYWNVALVQLLPEAEKTHRKGVEAFRAATQLAKNLSQEEKDRYAAIAESNREESRANYEKWIKSHSPIEIRDANIARRKLGKLRGRRLTPLHDDRLVKSFKLPLTYYVMERNDTGNFKHLSGSDMIRQVTEEWRNMSASDKEKYVKLSDADKARYVRECQEIYGEQPSTN